MLPWSVTAAGVIYNVQLFADNGVEVPTTYSELEAACQKFQSAGVTPIYTTARDTWTLQQGMWDYATGSGTDVPAFFKTKLADDGGGTRRTFRETFGDVMTKVLNLRQYFNPDYPSKTYADGNLAMGQGKVAMYLQGPWALGEVAKTDADLKLGTFSIPMTEDPEVRAARVNLDLAMRVPTASSNVEAAKAFVQWMMQPEVCNTYNQENRPVPPPGREGHHRPAHRRSGPLPRRRPHLPGSEHLRAEHHPVGQLLPGRAARRRRRRHARQAGRRLGPPRQAVGPLMSTVTARRSQASASAVPKRRRNRVAPRVLGHAGTGRPAVHAAHHLARPGRDVLQHHRLRRVRRWKFTGLTNYVAIFSDPGILRAYGSRCSSRSSR